jgi:hypothetical protein
MALVLADRVRDTTTTTGTGTVTLSGAAPTGYQNFSVIGNANTTYYTINADSQWEVGIGTYTSSGTTLSRNTVLASSNGGALVDFAAGIKDVFVTYPSEKAVTEDYGNALAATTAANLAGGAAGSIPYQTAANTTAMLATGTGVLIGGTTPSYTMSPSLTQVTVAADPTTNLEVATKQYVDTQTSSGIHYHEPVRVESPINLNATYNNGTAGVGATLTNAGTQVALVIDGVTLSVADRVLIYEQTDETQNGIYVVTSVGSGSTNWVLTRSSDADTYVNASPDGLSEGSTVFVQQGTTGAGETYTCNTAGTIVFGTTAITFAQISSAQIYSAGTGLTLTGTTFSLTSPVATTLGGTGLTSFTTGGAVYATSSSTLTTGTLPATAGGTGQSSYTTGDLLYAASATTIGVIADVATGNALISGGAGADPSYGKIGLTTHISGTLAVGNGGTGATSLTGYLVGNGTAAFSTTSTIPTSDLSGTISLTTQVSGTLGAGNGGTGISSYTVGDILYASGTTALSKLPDVATGNALLSGGVSNAPLWGKVDLVTHITGTLEVGNGGTGAVTLTTRGVLIGNGTNAVSATPAGTTGQVLVGNTGADPSWATLTGIGVTSFSAGTTGFTPATATTGAVTLAGTLNVANGGTSNTTLAANYLLKGNGVSPIATSVIYDDGTNASIGTTSPGARFEVYQSAGGSNSIRMNTNFAGGNYVDLNPSISGVSNGGFSLSLNGTICQVISVSGNLGVGSSSPSARITAQVNSGNYILDLVNGSETPFALRTYNHGSGSAPGLVFTQGLYYNTTENASIKFYRGGGATGGYLGFTVTDGTERLSINGNGNVIANVDMRAPIFYDSNDTAYYIDGAGNSVLNTLYMRNGSIEAKFAQASNFGYSSSYRTVVLGNEYLTTISMGVDVSGNASGSFNGQGEGREVLFRNGVTFITPNSANNSYLTPLTLADGYAASTGSFRAPIFYDSDNTGYYLNPNGASLLNTVNIDTLLNVSNGASLFLSSASAAYQRVDSRNEGSDARAHWYGVTTAGATSNFRHAWYDGAAYFNITASSSQITFERTAGNTAVYSAGDFRAPIFYDSNDTSYYVNPNSTSVLNALIATNYIETYGDLYTRGNIYSVNAALNGWNTIVDRNGGNPIVYGYDSVRAPIFYDSNNTAYYVDPASTSNLNVVNVQPNNTTSGGGINFNGAGNAFIRGTNVDNAVAGGSNLQLQSWFGIGFGPSISGQPVPIGENAAWIDCRNGDLTARRIITGLSDVRAPIFYDSNNTAYYGDFAGVTNLADLRAPNVVHYPGWPGFPGIDANAYGFNAISSFTYTNNAPWTGPFVSFAAGGYNLQLNAPYGGGSALSFRTRNGDTSAFNSWYSLAIYGANPGAGNLYAAIYYDANNTAYYLDPAGSSVLGIITAQSINDAQLYLNGNGTSWAGIQWTDVSASDNMWYNGSTSTFAIGGGGSVVANKKLHINGGTTIGSGIAASSSGVNSLLVEADIYSGNGRLYLDNATNNFIIAQAGSSSALYLEARGGGLRVRNAASGDSWFTALDGTCTATTDFRAPIFYDSNNTAYYIDPASGTVLGGNFSILGGRPLTYAPGGGSLTIQGDAGGWGTGLYFLGSSGTNLGGFGGYGGGNSLVYLWAGTSLSAPAIEIYAAAQYAQSPGSFRAPIFYDSNNTGYYVDPTVQSYVYEYAGPVTYGSYGSLSIIGQTNNYAGIAFPTKSSTLMIGDGGATPSGFYFGNSAWGMYCYSNGGIYTHLMYDLDNTAYYVDPTGTSALSTVTFGSSPNGGGGGGRIIPSTGSPYSLRQEFGSDNSGWRYGIAKNVSGTVTVMFYVQDNGDCVATGNVTAYSDIRLKANIETIPSALDKLDQIRGVTYTRTDMDDKERRYAGVIAQEIEAVLPEAIGGDEDIKTVDYNATIALLIQAVKELTDKVKALEAKEQ